MNAIRRTTVFMAIISLIAIAVILVIESRSNDGELEKFNYVTPVCVYEDGSTQDTCVWHYETTEGEPRTLVNANYGEFTYYPHTDTWLTWDSEPSAETVRQASS